MDLLDEVRATGGSAKFFLIKSSQREARFKHFWARASGIVKIRSGRLDLSMGPGRGSGAPGLLGPFPGQDTRMFKSKPGSPNPGRPNPFQKPKSSPGSPNTAQEVQIQPRQHKSSSGRPNPAQAAQIHPKQAKSSPGSPDPAQEASKCFEIGFWAHPGTISWPGLQNASKLASGRLLALFPRQGFKMP